MMASRAHPSLLRWLAAVTAIVSCLALPARAAPVPLTVSSWDASPLSHGWRITDPAYVSFVKQDSRPTILHVVSPSPAGKDQNAQYDLPLDLLRGSVVEVSVEIRAVGVTQPQHSYNGIKAQVHLVDQPRGDTWTDADANGATFPANYDWTRIRFEAMIPESALTGDLLLGMQESSGTVDFRNLKLTVLRTVSRSETRTASGPVYTGHDPGHLRGFMISPDIQPSDVTTLKRWHVNLVRWQLLWSEFPHSPADSASLAEYDAWLKSSLRHLDTMLPVFRAAGINVVIDMHTPPGGRDAANACRIFTDPAMQIHFLDCWSMIANRYKKNPTVWGYDLVNEPVFGTIRGDLLDWRDLAEKTAQRVRAIDSKHAIIIEPAPWGSVDALPFFTPLDVRGIVYSVHFYSPMEFTHQGVLPGYALGPAYPGVIAGAPWDRERIRSCFQPVVDYAKRNHVAIYVGEFSAVRWAKGSDQYIADVVGVLEENGWDWSYHAFREWQGWSPEVGTDQSVTTPSATPTARLRVLQAAFAKNAPPAHLCSSPR